MLIVIAEKDPYDLEVLKSGLSSPDREIVAVADGDNVITLARSRQIDVVIVSASIGHQGGFGVCYELKRMAENNEIMEPKVIVMKERDADAWLADWSMCDAHPTKPIDPAEIDELVTDLTAAPAAS